MASPAPSDFREGGTAGVAPVNATMRRVPPVKEHASRGVRRKVSGMVEGDPLQDLSVLKHNLRMVVHDGVIIRDERPDARPVRPTSGRRVSPGGP